MREASVGFQCPSCVAEGRRTTRQARTAYGGVRQSPGGVGLVSKTLIAINAAVWALILATGGNASVWVDRLALRPKGACLTGRQAFDVSHAQCTTAHGTWLPGVSDGAWWQPVTSMFTQVEILHIGFNMLALWILGPQLELVLGRARFLSLYLLSGLVGSAAVYVLSPEFTPTLGASGAIFGLMAALLVIALKQRADVSQLMVWIGINVALTFFSTGISWQGHLGGFFGGLALAGVLVYAPRQRRTTWQVAGFAGVALLVAVTFALRTAALS
jgi:membrane associated rhomboid family serine protease